MQLLPVAQSVEVVQPDLHPVLVHVYPPQSVVRGMPHAPVPSHAALALKMPFTQVCARHSVAASGYVHAIRVMPSHVPLQSGSSAAQGSRTLRGKPVTARQVPSWPPSAQDSHC
jgi:hypothetical protein